MQESIFQHVRNLQIGLFLLTQLKYHDVGCNMTIQELIEKLEALSDKDTKKVMMNVLCGDDERWHSGSCAAIVDGIDALWLESRPK